MSSSDCRQIRNFEFAYSLFSFKLKLIAFEIELVDFRFGGAFRGRGPILLVAVLLRGIGLHAFPAGVAAYTTINYFLNIG